jgi:hypothetical protein
MKVIVGGGDGWNSQPVSPPLNARGGTIPREPPNGRWSTLNPS